MNYGAYIYICYGCYICCGTYICLVGIELDIC
jgi:hypothetical protein